MSQAAVPGTGGPAMAQERCAGERLPRCGAVAGQPLLASLF